MASAIRPTSDGVAVAEVEAEPAAPSPPRAREEAQSIPSAVAPASAVTRAATGTVGREHSTSAARSNQEAPADSARAVAKARAESAAQLVDMVARAPQAFDFFQVLRRLECAYLDSPRLGEALRPAEEPIRLGQEATPIFAPSALSGLRAGRGGRPPWLLVHFMGLFGANGPLPLHLTEYARDRQRNADDPTFVRFLDLFHHRMLLMFYRAWANSQPTVSHDRPASNRFFTYVGASVGIGSQPFRNRDDFPDSAKMFYAGLFGAQTRHAAGLASIIRGFFEMPAQIEEFVGSWLDLPIANQWALGRREGPGAALLGVSTTLGAHAWTRQQKFRVVLGPLTRVQFRRMLPGTPSLAKLTSLVRGYIGDELRWDLRLVMDDRTEEPLHLGKSHLGWTAWLGRQVGAAREDLILDPQAESVLGAAAA